MVPSHVPSTLHRHDIDPSPSNSVVTRIGRILLTYLAKPIASLLRADCEAVSEADCEADRISFKDAVSNKMDQMCEYSMFTSNHHYDNVNGTCQKCGETTLLFVGCHCPKDRRLVKKCEKCIKKEMEIEDKNLKMLLEILKDQ